MIRTAILAIAWIVPLCAHAQRVVNTIGGAVSGGWSSGTDPNDGWVNVLEVKKGAHVDLPGGGRIEGPITITVHGKAHIVISGDTP